mgnify:CR=1 FL=1
MSATATSFSSMTGGAFPPLEVSEVAPVEMQALRHAVVRVAGCTPKQLLESALTLDNGADRLRLLLANVEAYEAVAQENLALAKAVKARLIIAIGALLEETESGAN